VDPVIPVASIVYVSFAALDWGRGPDSLPLPVMTVIIA